MAQELSLNGQNLLKEFERLGPNVRNDLIYPYICIAGQLTVAWGHVIRDFEAHKFLDGLSVIEAKVLYKGNREAFFKKCKPLTRAQADALLREDLKDYCGYVNERLKRWNVKVAQPLFDALVSLAYNGGPAFLDGTIKTRLIAGDIDGAILWFPMFCLADVHRKDGTVMRNVPVTGLTLRRYSEVWLALTNQVWRIGKVRATRDKDIEKFLSEVRRIMKMRGKESPLPYPRNEMKNQAA